MRKPFCLAGIWLVVLVVGVIGVVSSQDADRAEGVVEGYQLTKERIIDYWASQPVTPDPQAVFFSYEAQAEAALARLVKGIDLANANNYFEHTPPNDPSEGQPSQYRNVLVINTAGKPLIHAPLLGREFEIREVDGTWTFIQEGGAYAAIRTLDDSLYLLEVRLASDYPSFAHFKNDIKDNPLTGTAPYTYTSTRGDTIEFTDRITKVNGRAYDTGDYELFDSPFVNSEWDSGYVVVRKDGRELVLDFTDRAQPRRIITK